MVSFQINTIPKIDYVTNVAMTSIENPLLTSFSKLIATTFDTISLVLISLLISIYFFRKNQSKNELFFAGSMIFTSGVVFFLKEIFARARPLGRLIPETNFSFPSGHTTATTVFVGLLAYISTRNKPKNIQISAYMVAGLIALIVAFTRLYLRVHWLTDVLAGFITGISILIIAIILDKKFRLQELQNKSNL